MRLDRWFDYESGYAWCESAYKYQTVSVVAEFANTVTNLPLIMLPLLNVLLIKPYIETVNWIVIMPHILLTVNGIASTYYHATLNLFDKFYFTYYLSSLINKMKLRTGQLIDEISILWLLMMCLAAYFPVFSFYPQQYHKYIGRVRCAIAVITMVVSTFCFVKPSLNALVLMLWSIPSIAIIRHEAANAGIPEIISSPRKISVLWTAASICWVSDRVFCDFWLFLESNYLICLNNTTITISGTPYFHALFHLLSSLAAYNVFIMFSLIDICRRSDKHRYRYRIKHFPEKGLIRLPYIVLNLDCKYL
uniref:Alkaline ceramidase n=1 Tax=Wuchereria bancrofti TaxID=6293 RepID=A0AAF5Q354_WUCBA